MKIPYSTTSYFPLLQTEINNVTVAKTTHRAVLAKLLHVKLLLLQVRLLSRCRYSDLGKGMCTTEAIR